MLGEHRLSCKHLIKRFGSPSFLSSRGSLYIPLYCHHSADSPPDCPFHVKDSPLKSIDLPAREHRAFHLLVEATLAARPDTLSSADARAALSDGGFDRATINAILRHLHDKNLITAARRADKTVYVDTITHAGWRTYAECVIDDYHSTLQRVYDWIADADRACTAQEVASALDLSPWLVRHCMEELERRGNGHVVMRPDGITEMRVDPWGAD